MKRSDLHSNHTTDPPRFINYSAGEYQPPGPQNHPANFRRISSRPPMSATRQTQVPEPELEQVHEEPSRRPQENGHGANGNGWTAPSQQQNLRTEPVSIPPIPNETQRPPQLQQPQQSTQKPPFGGIAMPGMAATSSAPPLAPALPLRQSSMAPPPVPPSMTMPEPRIPSRQGPPSPIRDVNDEEDPMAKALADLRRDPPPPGSVRRNISHRRPESVSNAGSTRNSTYGQDSKSPPSPAPNTNRMSYQQGPTQSMPAAQSNSSIDMTLSPPASGHTSAALAKSMDDFQRSSSRGPEKRQSFNYANYANDVVGAHPASRPASPAGSPRAPSPAMMQPPRQPPSPVADEVLSRYHQALPGERSRSRAGSVVSSRSRANSTIAPNQAQQPPQPVMSPAAAGREAFAGIGAGGGRGASPQPPQFRSPSPSPIVKQGSLGPQNIGISLDEKGGVAHDSMAEAYRRQYQQQQQGQQQPPPQQAQYTQQQGSSQPQQYTTQRQSQYGQQSEPKSPVQGSSYPVRPISTFTAPQQSSQQPSYNQPSSQQQYGQPPQQQYQQYQSPPSQQQYSSYFPQPQQTPQQPPQQTSYQQQQNPMSPRNGYGPSAANGYASQSQQRQSYVAPPTQQYQPQQNQYARTASPAPQQQTYYARTASPAPQPQRSYARAPSPTPQQTYQPQQQAYGHHTTSPQPQAIQRSPSPQPGVPPSNAAPTGQWATNGLPVLFCQSRATFFPIALMKSQMSKRSTITLLFQVCSLPA